MSINKHKLIIYFSFINRYNEPMGNKEKRLDALKKMIQLERSMKISEISDRLHVSPMTTRRDIEILAQDGTVKVLHGVVVSNSGGMAGGLSDYMLAVAETRNIDEKKAIARHALNFVEEDDIIFIDAGSTTETFASMLPPDIRLTVVCYSINIFLAVASHKNIEVLLTGGHYSRKTTILELSQTSPVLQHNRTRKAFISASGYHQRLGVTCAHQSECITKKAAMNNTAEAFLLMDSSKFDVVHSCHFADIEQFSRIFTNESIPTEYHRLLKEKGITVDYVR